MSTKNKKGMELSINFIVMLILAIVVFGLAVTLTYKFMQQAYTTQRELDQQTRAQILDALDTGAKVAVIPESINIRTGKSDIVGIGIRNILDSGDTFSISVKWSAAIDEQGETISTATEGTTKWFIYPTTKTIKKFERDAVGVAFNIPGGAKAGTYIYDVMVCKPEVLVGNCIADPSNAPTQAYDQQIHKIYVYVS
ncbi:MAG: hypothetical protein Q7J54_05760 [Candidatus Woesearchaeota archaeon]|nr:hypothetical protein [Candidatus Woesearchaeota archaeon]